MFRLGYRTIALDVLYIQDTLDLSFLTGPCLTEDSRVLCLIASGSNKQPKCHVTPDGRRSLLLPRVCERETWRTTKLVLFLSTFSLPFRLCLNLLSIKAFVVYYIQLLFIYTACNE